MSPCTPCAEGFLTVGTIGGLRQSPSFVFSVLLSKEIVGDWKICGVLLLVETSMQENRVLRFTENGLLGEFVVFWRLFTWESSLFSKIPIRFLMLMSSEVLLASRCGCFFSLETCTLTGDEGRLLTLVLLGFDKSTISICSDLASNSFFKFRTLLEAELSMRSSDFLFGVWVSCEEFCMKFSKTVLWCLTDKTCAVLMICKLKKLNYSIVINWIIYYLIQPAYISIWKMDDPRLNVFSITFHQLARTFFDKQCQIHEEQAYFTGKFSCIIECIPVCNISRLPLIHGKSILLAFLIIWWGLYTS